MNFYALPPTCLLTGKIRYSGPKRFADVPNQHDSKFWSFEGIIFSFKSYINRKSSFKINGTKIELGTSINLLGTKIYNN